MIALLAMLACHDAPVAEPIAGCAGCHDAAEAPPGTHAAFGCAACHLGDARASTADAAHTGLEREPGALQTVDRTCGLTGCHDALAARVRTSPMATGRGIVSVDRFAFGELPAPDGDRTLPDVLAAAHPTPAEDHLRRLCGGCHLHARAANRDDAISGVGSGCGACHVTKRTSRYDGHPAIDLDVGDRQCLGCHSRSGRISLSYQGLAEHRGGACDEPVALHDGRPGCRQPDDAHHAAGMACVDCHLHTELMGDGTAWGHEEQATELTCDTCHRPRGDERTWATVDDPTTAAILRHRGQARSPEEPVRVGLRGTPVWNLRATDAGGWALHPKAGGPPRAVPPTPADADHALPGHARLTCDACHAAWAPKCATCHTQAADDGAQWDFGAGALAPGQWIETADRFDVAPPALGVYPDNTVGPVVPGMIWTLDGTALGGPTLAARRYAPSVPHTTSRTARTCASCHADPYAIGLGSGTLDLDGPTFTPSTDDGWTTLFPAAPATGTRVGLRSLDADEQRRVLRVAPCLPCHATSGPPWTLDAPFNAPRNTACPP